MRARKRVDGRGLGVEPLESRALMAVTVAEFPLPSSPRSAPAGIVSGPGGKLWFTEEVTKVIDGQTVAGGAIGSIDPATGAIAEYAIPYAGSNPAAIVWGQDGDLWFADYGTGGIGQFDPSNHAILEYAPPTAKSGPLAMLVVGSKIWFTESSASRIGVIDPATHAVADYPLNRAGETPSGLAQGGDGNLYYTDPATGSIGQFNPAGHGSVEFPIGQITSAVAPGPDGGLYFGTASYIARGASQRPVIQEIGPTRVFNVYSGPSDIGAGGATGGLVSGPGGLLYYTSGNHLGPNSGNVNQAVTQIGSLDPSTGAYTTSATFAGGPSLFPSIAVGPDNTLWFTTGGYIGVARVIPSNQAAITGTVAPANTTGQVLASEVVYFDTNDNGRFDPGEPSAISGTDGSYTLAGLPIGAHNVLVQSYAGNVQAPTPVTTTGGGLAKGVNLYVHTSALALPIRWQPQPFGGVAPDVTTAEVTGLYNILLGHAPDPQGLASWVNAVKNGTPFSSVVDAFLHSTAYYDRVVGSFYQALVGRAGSTADVDGWVALLQQGYSEEQVLQLMLTSPGYTALYPSDAAFINNLYEVVLGRESDATPAWTAYLAGTTRSAVVAQFIHSGAAYQRAAIGFLDAIWGAPADQAAVNNVATALANGATLSQVAAIFFESPQYAAYANKSVG